MRELRTCPVHGQTVLLNDAWPDRLPLPTRDVDAAQANARLGAAPCAWCRDWPHVLGRQGAALAIPHPTPALGVEGDSSVHDLGDRVWREAVGAHELLLCAHPEPDAGGAGDDACLRLARARLTDLRQDGRLRGFKLIRRDIVGAHPMWQLIALPFDVAPEAPAPWREAELRTGTRVLAQTTDASAILAWAPRSPFEAWILPTLGRTPFAHGPTAPVAALARATCARIRHALGPVEIDLVVVDGEPWRIELRPRLTGASPVEVATGLPMHGTFPERAAAWLRAARES